MIGNGRNHYQLLEVTDLAQAYWLACTVGAERANHTFNIGAERFQTVREDIQALCDFAGSGARPMGTPAALVKLVLRVLETLKLSPLYKWVYLTADRDSFVSIERAKAQLGWQPVYSNAEVLIRSYQWYLEQASGLEVGVGVTHRVAWGRARSRCSSGCWAGVGKLHSTACEGETAMATQTLCSPNRYGNVFRTSAGAWAGRVFLLKDAGETQISEERHYA